MMQNINTSVDYIFDVTQQEFQKSIIDSSHETPIIVDFWAPWCEPCKQLIPMLEQIVKSHNGKVKMAKVNVDENQAIAQQLQIKSVPMVYAFYKGRPVDGFAGVKSQSDIESFITKLVNLSAGFDPEKLEEILNQADVALANNDYGTSLALYGQVFGLDSKNKRALSGMLSAYIKSGDLEIAQEILDGMDDELRDSSEIQAIIKAMAFAENSDEASSQIVQLETMMHNSPNDLQIQFDLAVAYMSAGQEQNAVDVLLNIITQDKDWNDGQARNQLLEFFEIIGMTNPITLKGRRRLSSMLFS